MSISVSNNLHTICLNNYEINEINNRMYLAWLKKHILCWQKCLPPRVHRWDSEAQWTRTPNCQHNHNLASKQAHQIYRSYVWWICLGQFDHTVKAWIFSQLISENMDIIILVSIWRLIIILSYHAVSTVPAASDPSIRSAGRPTWILRWYDHCICFNNLNLVHD